MLSQVLEAPPLAPPARPTICGLGVECVASDIIAGLRQPAPQLTIGTLTHENQIEALQILADASIPLVHIDIMDETVWPKTTVGPDFTSQLQTGLLKDVHLLIDQPDAQIPAFAEAGAAVISFCVEYTPDIGNTLSLIENGGEHILRGVSLNPSTPVETIEPYLAQIDLVILLAIGSHEAVADGWNVPEPERAPDTHVRREVPRSLITFNRSPDLPFDRTINPYRGCEHGCVYCFARPTHAYLDLSPGLDFETRLVWKADADQVLLRQLASPSYRCAPIALGASTDPYQPIERRYGVTRRILETLLACRHPVSIVTKGALIERDLDLLAELAAQRLVSVAVSVTTLAPELKRQLEPRASSGARRLQMIERLVAAGVPVSVLAAPIMPFVNDAELEDIVSAAAKAGATGASYVILRLPHELTELFEDWLAQHYPDRKERVLNAVRAMRGGRLYDSRWGQRQSGQGALAQLIARRFELARARHGLNDAAKRTRLDTSAFAVPPSLLASLARSSHSEPQLALF
ncbi:MAG: PA0069 family radical SAM protein [Pseudomonadota bacterium]